MQVIDAEISMAEKRIARRKKEKRDYLIWSVVWGVGIVLAIYFISLIFPKTI
jgi:hypothetical protein